MTVPRGPEDGVYEILDHLAEGGMGAVYLARHTPSSELRVIKMIRPGSEVNEQVKRRFERETRLMVQIHHPNIVHAFDSSVDEDGTAFLVLEHIDGVTFKELVTRGGVPSLGLGLEIARQGLLALDFVHQQGIVHRDVAADNLMVALGEEGEPRVKLIDLGIAKRIAGGGTHDQLTRIGTFLGKARYTAPEQFAEGGAQNLDMRSDLYSFGVLLYELLTGSCPILGRNFSEVLSHHLFKPPLPFAESDPGERVPEGVRAAVLRALDKKPTRRPANAQELAAMLAPHMIADASHGEELAELLARAKSFVEDDRKQALAKARSESEDLREPPPGPSRTEEVALRLAKIFPETGREVPGAANEPVSESDHISESMAVELLAEASQPRPRVEGEDREEDSQVPDSERTTVRGPEPDFVTRERGKGAHARSLWARTLQRLEPKHLIWLAVLLGGVFGVAVIVVLLLT